MAFPGCWTLWPHGWPPAVRPASLEEDCPPMRTSPVRSPAVRPGDTVAIVSTSSPVTADELGRLRHYFEDRGHPALLGTNRQRDRPAGNRPGRRPAGARPATGPARVGCFACPAGGTSQIYNSGPWLAGGSLFRQPSRCRPKTGVRVQSSRTSMGPGIPALARRLAGMAVASRPSRRAISTPRFVAAERVGRGLPAKYLAGRLLTVRGTSSRSDACCCPLVRPPCRRYAPFELI